MHLPRERLPSSKSRRLSDRDIRLQARKLLIHRPFHPQFGHRQRLSGVILSHLSDHLSHPYTRLSRGSSGSTSPMTGMWP